MLFNQRNEVINDSRVEELSVYVLDNKRAQKAASGLMFLELSKPINGHR